MAQKKGGGSTDNGRDSAGRRLGLKCGNGQAVKPGQIIIRQRGTVYKPGNNVFLGKDHTIHAKIFGTLKFKRTKLDRVVVNVEAFKIDSEISNDNILTNTQNN